MRRVLFELNKEFTMQSNVGGVDRVLRVVAGLALIGAGFYWQSWWGAIGLVPLLTGMAGICPLYYPLKLSTCKKCQ
jgi:hypothetical protein